MDLHTARAALLRVEANLCTDETNIVALKVGALNDSLAIPLLLEAAFKNQRALVNLLLALLPGDVAAAAPIDDAAVQDAQAAAINERSREVPDAKAFVWLTRGRQESVGEVSIPDTGAPAHAP